MNQWTILRKVLGALGLSAEKIDDVIATIQGWLSDDEAAKNPNKTQEPLPYQLRDGLLTPAEHNFYRVLLQSVKVDQVLMSKVNLGDIFKTVTPDSSKWRVYRNKIDRKHIDFLLCDAKTMTPLLGIELDDRSHQRKSRQQRDKFVDRVFAVAGLPILHIRAAYSYNPADLSLKITEKVGAVAGTTLVQVQAEGVEKFAPPTLKPNPPDEKQLCPKCSAEMVLRTASRGTNKGNKFWGCRNYPSCKGILSYSD